MDYVSEYQVLARRTQNPDLTKEERTLHAVLGLASEVAEYGGAVSREERIMELGDICWFAAELCDVAGWSLKQLAETARECVEEVDVNIDKMITYAGVICGIIQKTYQGHELEWVKIKPSLTVVLCGVINYAKRYKVEDGIEGVMAANIEKLRKRYPVKFTAEASINRVE